MNDMMNKTKEIMKCDGIDYLIVTSFDEHFSEYTDEYYHNTYELTDFSGDSSVLIIKKEHSYLFTDSRYFLQAEMELDSDEVTLMREGTADSPTWIEWLLSDIRERAGFDRRIKVAFDGKRMPAIYGEQIAEILHSISEDTCSNDNKAVNSDSKTSHFFEYEIITDRDITGEIWTDRPPARVSECFIYDIKYSGRSAEEKLSEVRTSMREKNAKYHLVSSLDNIAWLLNLRADDILHTPVMDAFILMSQDECMLYTDKGHFESPLQGEKVRAYLDSLSVSVKDKKELYSDLSGINDSILLDKNNTSYRALSCVMEDVEIIDSIDPESELKCIKNETEIEGIRNAQHKDSLAVTRFMYYFKNTYDKAADPEEICEEDPLTECSAAGILHEFRTHGRGFLDESFETISAYAENAAIVHYMPDRDSDTLIDARGLYLVDSGGHYFEGTTDVTRTWSAGPVTDEEKKAVTLCIMGNLRLAMMTFPEGTPGSELDAVARKPLKDHGYDYGHGTGHGVGCYLNVHEEPVRISPKASYPFKAGMYVSDEPGIYIDGKFGVRIENMLLSKKLSDGKLGFEIMTLVPFDPSCIDFSLMTEEDLRIYNEYQHRVYSELVNDLNEEESLWLRTICYYTDSMKGQ